MGYGDYRRRGSYRDRAQWEDPRSEETSSTGWLLVAGAVALWLWSKLQEESGARRQSEQREAEATRQAEEARRDAEEARRDAEEAHAREQQMRRRAEEAQAEANRQKQLAQAAEAELKRQQSATEEQQVPQDEEPDHPGAGPH